MRPVRSVFQVLLAVLGWVGFGAAWYYVFWSRSVTAHGWLDVAEILGLATVMVLVTMLWVLRNVGIYRRKGARAQVSHVVHDFSRDAQGTPVIADFAALRASRFAEVALATSPDGTTEKTYISGSTELSDEEAAACTM
ncbi:MAG: hypothetical protein IMZ75_00720 [Actinobacteria bacterium]|nr:hypothetical protein [Actinomycetota bacterium]